MVRTMPPKCRPDVAAARAQTERMIADAEKAIGTMPAVHVLSGPGFSPAVVRRAPRSAEHCSKRLETARAVFAAAGEQSDLIKQRDSYIHATYQAGQALSCARAQAIGKKLGTMPSAKKPKKKAP